MKKVIACLLALVLFCGAAMPAFAAGDVNRSLIGETSLAKIGSLRISTGGKAKRLVLKWSAVPRANTYQVFRSTTGKTGSYKLLADDSTTTYTDTSLKNSTVYYYAVRARAWNGQKSIYSPFKKICLSTRVTKAYASARFAQVYKAMHKFVHAYDRNAVEKGTAIEAIRDGWYGYYFPFTLKGCAAKADAVQFLRKYLQKKAAKSVADFMLKSIRGRLYIWLPQDLGFTSLVINDIPTVKMSCGDKQTVCKFGTYYVTGPDELMEYSPVKLAMVFENGRWVFADNNYWYDFSFAYQSVITPNDGPGADG